MKATINHKNYWISPTKNACRVHQKVDNDDAILTKKTTLWLLLHHLVIIHYCFCGLLVAFKCLWSTWSDGYMPFPVTKIQHFVLLCLIWNTTRRLLELPTINSLLSLVAMKTFVWLFGVLGFDWDREWHQHHGSWCMKCIAMRVHLSPQRISHWSSEKLGEMPITWKCSFFM
jgi:hypothetical protein